MGLGHHGPSTQWDWGTIGQHTMGLAHTEPSTHWDWDMIGLVHKGTGTPCALGLGHNGPIPWQMVVEYVITPLDKIFLLVFARLRATVVNQYLMKLACSRGRHIYIGILRPLAAKS